MYINSSKMEWSLIKAPTCSSMGDSNLDPQRRAEKLNKLGECLDGEPESNHDSDPVK